LDIITTIDPKIQIKEEDLTANYSRSLKLKGISNAAVIAIDNKTRQVLAYIGSPDFFDTQNNGQVDGIRALRSPGSALKPIVYGLAFDKGFATPKMVIADVPVDFQGYTPENYDLNFRGNVTVEEALKQSLNIPAIKMLNKIGIPLFVNALHTAGFSSVWEKRNKLGLSMILGGCGVRLDEMAALYASFANHGQFKPLSWRITENNRQDASVQILSPEAAYMLTQILKELQRPDLPNANVSAENIPKIAWKTGTSYGRRDAWSIGYNEQYTIAVWAGNFSGKGVPDLSGATIATPLLFQLFNAIGSTLQPAPDMPQGLQPRMVCAESGMPPNDFCTNQIMDIYIPGVSGNAPCTHLKNVFLSADEKFSYCTSCLPSTGYKTKWYPNIDPDLANYYELHHIKYEKIPEHNPVCTRNFTGAAPRINSLSNGTTYLITDKGKQQLQLSCIAANDVAKVFWYVNDKFVGSCSKNDKLLFSPDNRNIKISCTDDKGRNTNIHIVIKFV
jgi:penicillin-binding protein 1C